MEAALTSPSEPSPNANEPQRASDGASAERLYQEHRDALRRYVARSLGPDRGAAEDLVQEVFVRALGPGVVLPPEPACRPWLYRIATNLVIDHHRAARRRRSEQVDPDMPDAGPGPEAALIRDDLRERIRDAVARLPDEQREVFLLREYGDVPFKEIALRTGAPLGTVLARMHYAMTKVKRDVEGAEPRRRATGKNHDDL